MPDLSHPLLSAKCTCAASILLHICHPCAFRLEKLRLEVAQGYQLEPGMPPREIIKAVFKPVAEASIVRMQNIIEGLCHAVKKQERKRDEAGGK